MHGFKDLSVNERDENYQIGIRSTHQSSLAASTYSLLVFTNYNKGQDSQLSYAVSNLYPGKQDHALNQKCLSLIPGINLFTNKIMTLPKELTLNYLNFFSVVIEKAYSTQRVFSGFASKLSNWFPEAVVGGIVSLGTGIVGEVGRTEFRLGGEITFFTKLYKGCKFGLRLGNCLNVPNLLGNLTKKYAYIDAIQDTRLGLVFAIGSVQISQNMNCAGIGSTDISIQVKSVYNAVQKYITSNNKAK